MDKKIEADADSWEQEHHKTERERIRRKDERLRAWGRFVKRVLMSSVGVGVIGGGIFGIVVLQDDCNAESARNRKIEEKVDLFYDDQRIACINDHGREQCDVWFEIGMHQCDKINAASKCIHEHKGDRAEKLDQEGRN